MEITYNDHNRLITFVSVHQAIFAERVLKEGQVKTIAMPTPREIDLSCGHCLLFKESNEQELLDILEKNKVVWSKIFERIMPERRYVLIGQYGG